MSLVAPHEPRIPIRSVQRASTMKRFLSRILGPVMLLALLPVLALPAPSQAAATQARRRPDPGHRGRRPAGRSSRTTRVQPTASTGWSRPRLQAPQQFYCDQTSNGGGWVLVGRGRQGWKTIYDGLRTPAEVRNTITGTGGLRAGPAALQDRRRPAQRHQGLRAGRRHPAPPRGRPRRQHLAGGALQDGHPRPLGVDLRRPARPSAPTASPARAATPAATAARASASAPTRPPSA